MTKHEKQNFTFRLDNKNRANGHFLIFILSGIVFTGIAFYLIGHENALPLVLEVLAAIVFFVVLAKIKPTYFEFLVYPDHFAINYYMVASVTRDYQSIEVPLNEFSHFSISRSFFGLRKELVISVRTTYGVADYPPISISILKKLETEQLMYVLRKISLRQQGEDEGKL